MVQHRLVLLAVVLKLTSTQAPIMMQQKLSFIAASAKNVPVIYHVLRHPTWQRVQQLGSQDNLHSKIVNQKEGKYANDFATKALEHGTLSAAQSKAILGAAQAALGVRKAFAASRKHLASAAAAVGSKPVHVLRAPPDLVAAASAAHAAAERARSSMADAKKKVAAAAAAAAKLVALEKSPAASATGPSSSIFGVALPL
mmetsp:Transcript_24335/g.50924  ORF Transcript_24335/g.50924 Transcript_24335/m.50924 type:complete len:199 (-) Transcript_24335:118-714(-)